MHFSCGLLGQSEMQVTHGPASLGQEGIASRLGKGKWAQALKEQQGTGIKAGCLVLMEQGWVAAEGSIQGASSPPSGGAGAVEVE